MRINRIQPTAVLLVFWSMTACAQSSGAPGLSVDAAASRNPISPQIYGIANYGLDAAYAKEIEVPNIRWGGDGTSRYNWTVDSSNSGFDWYFMGGNGQATPVPGASADLMINTYAPANALMTIPILPYVNKSSAWSCSFPVSVYGAQQSTNPYVFPNGQTCGNSLTTSGTQLTDTNIYANHVNNTTSLQQSWIQHLVGAFGTAAQGGVKFYQLDNEPLGWGNTHRDVMPNGATYPTIVQLGQQYAAAVKQADSTALVFGPSDFTLGGWTGTPSQQNGLWAGQYYLQQMAAYQQQHGQRILDYFDEHYYFDTSTAAAQLASTRTLWDPTYNGGTWVEQYDFDGPMQLIPRFKSWIAAYYPGTKLSISEYSIDSGQKSIVDAIAEMDVLGIYGREQLDFANMWSPPAPTDPIAYSFRMFRNYDGNGHQFGDTSISAVSSDQGTLSLYAAQRSSDNAVTVLAINKTTSPISTAIAFANLNAPPTAQVYTYSAANLTSIVHAADAPISNAGLGYTFPGYSAVLFVLQATLIPTTTTLAASSTQIAAGSSLTFNAAVSAQSGSMPSGSISLMDGTTSLGTASLTNGTATFTITSLAAGAHTITASYSGNTVDGASVSNTVTVQVSQAAKPDYMLTLSSNTLSAAAGQSGTLMVTVNPESGFSASLSFACSGLPSGWTCSFSPATVSGATAQTSKLTVSAMSNGQNASPPTGVLFAVVCPLPLFFIGIGRRRATRSWSILLAVAVLMLGACGGGSDDASGNQSNTHQSKAYTVTVTASGSMATTHTQQFTLNVSG